MTLYAGRRVAGRGEWGFGPSLCSEGRTRRDGTSARLVLALLLAGCGETATPDASVDPLVDAAPFDAGHDAAVLDASSDGGHELDGGSESDAGADAGSVDAEMNDAAAIGDADVSDGALADAGSVDGGLEGDAGPAGPGTPIHIGASGDGSCVLTDANQMWCWGYGARTPMYVADATALNGTCGIALDGHAFCWNGAGITDYAGTDAAVLGVRTYAARPAGDVRALGDESIRWSPPVAADSLPALNCAVDVGGGLTCWDLVDTDPRPAVATYAFGNFWEAVPSTATYDVTDAARRGSFTAGDIIVCHTWIGTMPRAGAPLAGPGIECLHGRGIASPASFAGASEVEIAGGRACVVVPVGTSGTHPAGVYCTADRPAAFGNPGHWPLNPLAASDALDAYTDIVGTDLAVGTNHACIMQGADILCWGDNRRGQLGDGTLTTSRVPVRATW